MEVILRRDVEKLGRRGEVVKVTVGYGRNYLLPQGLALHVNDANRSMIDRERKLNEAKMAKEKAEFEALATRIASLRFIAPRRVGENDVLYGSVTAGDIADFLEAKGVSIDKRKIQLDEPVKTLGDHEVKIRLHPEVTANMRLLVTKTE